MILPFIHTGSPDKVWGNIFLLPQVSDLEFKQSEHRLSASHAFLFYRNHTESMTCHVPGLDTTDHILTDKPNRPTDNNSRPVLPLVVVSSTLTFDWLMQGNACNKCCNPYATAVATGCNGCCTRFATTVAKDVPYRPHRASHACRSFIGKDVGKGPVNLSERFRLFATFADSLFLSTKRKFSKDTDRQQRKEMFKKGVF